MSRAVALISCLLLFASGCKIARIENPLVNPSDAELYPELLGKYEAEKPKDFSGYFQLERAENDMPGGAIKIDSVAFREGKKEVESTYGFALKMGKHYLLHIPATTESTTPPERKDGFANVETYFLYRATFGKERIALVGLNNGFLEKQIAKKAISGKVLRKKSDSKSVRISEKSESLRKFVAKHIDGELFAKEPQYFTRVLAD